MCDYLYQCRARQRKSGANPALSAKASTQRNADGTCFAAQLPVWLPVHRVIVAVSTPPPIEGVRTRLQGCAAPVLVVATEITPEATLRPDTYCVAVVEQPELFRSMPARPAVACVERNSATEVLHAAAAASPSDIFDRIT